MRTVISTVAILTRGIPNSGAESRAVTETNFVPDDVDLAAQAPYFLRDESHFVPTEIARGGWGPSISGHVVGGLLGWAVERAVDDPQLQPARLTVDLPAPAALEPHRGAHQRAPRPTAVAARRGRSHPAWRPVARGSALFLRRGPQPDGQVWSQPCRCRRCPSSRTAPNRRFSCAPTAGAAKLQNPDPEWAHTSGPKYTWLHETRPLIDGEPLTAFTRAAMAADITAVNCQLGHKRVCSSSMPTTRSR